MKRFTKSLLGYLLAAVLLLAVGCTPAATPSQPTTTVPTTTAAITATTTENATDVTAESTTETTVSTGDANEIVVTTTMESVGVTTTVTQGGQSGTTTASLSSNTTATVGGDITTTTPVVTSKPMVTTTKPATTTKVTTKATTTTKVTTTTTTYAVTLQNDRHVVIAGETVQFAVAKLNVNAEFGWLPSNEAGRISSYSPGYYASLAAGTASHLATAPSKAGYYVPAVWTSGWNFLAKGAPIKVEATKSNYDVSWHEEYSKLYDPQESQFDDEAAAMRATMNALPDTLRATGSGVTYYVSYRGNDSNNGRSTATAIKTFTRLRQLSLKAGDVVLFERGGLYRCTTSYTCVSGVSYGAYGTGARPLIYGSNRNYADRSVWESMGGHVWKLNATFPAEVGNIVFDHGVAVGTFRDTKAELTNNYDFWCDRQNGNTTYLYLEMNPSDAFRSIEVCHDNLIFVANGLNNITLENLSFKYGTTALFATNVTNVTVRGCEAGFLGGAVLEGYDFNTFTTRCGGAFSFMSNSTNALVEKCWIYHMWDTGLTYQGEGIAKNFIMRNNLVEFCGMASFEYWGTEAQGSLIEGNLMRFAGCGFGGIQRADKTLRAHIQSDGKPEGAGYNKASNFIIRNNIFDQSAYQLINATSSAGTPPVFDGNTYVQVKGNRRRPLGYYKDVTQLYFDNNVANTIKNVVGDKNATVIYQ